MARTALKHGDHIAYFIVVDQIGEGGCGDVWRVRSTEDDHFYAMKLELPTVHRQNLRFEASVLRKIQASQRFPRLHIDGMHEGQFYLVEELLGANLTMLVDRLPSAAVLPPYLPRLANEMLFCIEDLHRFGYVHRDIKPQNFVVRLNGQVPLCLIDYGISRLYQTQSGQHIEARGNAPAIGSPIYASINTHNRLELSRRDDLISWIYSIVAMSPFRLPWMGQHLSPDELGRMKQQFPLPVLCRRLSPGFQAIANHVQNLEFAEVPNYQFMHDQLKKDTPEIGVPFEWMELEATGARPGGDWDPTGFVMSQSPWLQAAKSGKCEIM
jgi:serine/threonine protein kinase